MKVLAIHDIRYDPSGTGDSLTMLSAALGRRGHDVSLAVPVRGRGGRPPEVGRSVRIIHLSTNSGRIERSTIAETIRSEQPDIVFSRVPTAASVSAAEGVEMVMVIDDLSAVCPRGSKALFWSERQCDRPVGRACLFDFGFLRHNPAGRWGWKIGRAARPRRFLRRASRSPVILVPSEFLADELARNGFERGRIRVARPATVGNDRRSTDEREAAVSFLGKGEDPSFPRYNRVLYTGPLSRGAGVDLLLRAVRLILDRGAPANFVVQISGSGPAEEYVRKLTLELGLDRVIDFVPAATSPTRLERLVREAKIVVLPYRYPPARPDIGILAMQQSRPVVAFRCGCVAEWLLNGKTGYAVEPADVNSFAEGIRELVENDARARSFGASAGRYATSGFSAERYADTLETVCSAALGGRAGRAIPDES